MGFSRQEYWSGLPSPSPGDLPDPGIKPGSPASTGGFLSPEPQGNPSLALGWVKRGVREAILTSLYKASIYIIISTLTLLYFPLSTYHNIYLWWFVHGCFCSMSSIILFGM